MKERGIPMMASMVQATLEDRKRVTRRVMNPQPVQLAGPNHDGLWSDTIDPVVRYFVSPYGQPGDRLYVKEAAWMWCERRPNGTTQTGRPKWLYVPLRVAPVHYCADHPEKPAVDVVSPDTGNTWGWRKKVARFLPRWASRITLELTSVRVERVQEISEADAIAEGISGPEMNDRSPIYFTADPDVYTRDPVAGYRALWDSINAERGHGWDKNPWVWVIAFQRLAPLPSASSAPLRLKTPSPGKEAAL